MPKSVIEEIKELKAQLSSKTEQARTEAIQKATEAIAVLRDLGDNDNTIIKELGLKGEVKKTKAKSESKPTEEASCTVCNFETEPPHDGRSHRGQNKKKPFTVEELEAKGLTKIE
jgi:hypothetical protein